MALFSFAQRRKEMVIVTGSTGEAHVTPIDDAVRNGNLGYVHEKVVFEYLQNLEARKITENEVRVFSGYGMNQGRLFKIDRNDYDAVTIESGNQGVKRADLIVARYTLNTQTGVEDISLAVIKGQSGSTYTDPSYTEGEINEGDTLDDFPLYRVKIDGLIIQEVEPLFEVLPDGGRLGFIEEKIDNHIANDTDPHHIAWTEAATLAAISASETLAVQFGKIAKAIKDLIAHIANKNNPHEVSGAQLTGAVPISKGGTGATTAAGALQALGVPSNVADSMAKTVYCDENDYLKEGKGGIGNRGVNATDGGVSGSRDVTTAGALYSTVQSLQSTFRAGVNAIYNAIVNNGVTPSASTPTACATAINNIRSGGNAPASHILSGVSAYVNKVLVAGTMANYSGGNRRTVIPAAGRNTQALGIAGGYHDSVNVNTVAVYDGAWSDGYNAAQAISWTELYTVWAGSGTAEVDLALDDIIAIKGTRITADRGVWRTRDANGNFVRNGQLIIDNNMLYFNANERKLEIEIFSHDNFLGVFNMEVYKVAKRRW